jgi:hypothetical protein
LRERTTGREIGGVKMSDLNAAAKRLQEVQSLEELVGVLMDPDVQTLLSHPQVGKGWQEWVDRRREELSAPPAPPAPPAPTALAAPSGPGILGKVSATAEKAAEPAVAPPRAEAISMEAVASWEGKTWGQLKPQEKAAVMAEAKGIALEVFGDDVGLATEAARNYMRRASAEADTWEVRAFGIRRFFEQQDEWGNAIRAAKELLGNQRLDPEGFRNLVADLRAGMSDADASLAIAEGYYGPFEERKAPPKGRGRKR